MFGVIRIGTKYTGLYAATTGMYAVTVALANRLQRRAWAPYFVGAATITAGYLFAASEAGVHPTHFPFVASLAVAWALVAAIVLAVMLIVAFITFGNRDDSGSADGNDTQQE